MHAALSGTNLLWHTACCMPCSCLAAGVPAVLHLSMCCALQCPARRPAAPAGPQGAGGRRRRPGGTAAGGLDWAEWGGISVACLAVTNWECLCRCSQNPASICTPPHSTIRPQAYVVLLSALLALLPLENAAGADDEADERLLRELAAARDLDAKIGELLRGREAAAEEHSCCP